MEPRSQVKWFAEQMEERLRENDHKGGWKDDYDTDLYIRLIEEAQELNVAIESRDRKSIIKEAADVANFAMMIADNLRL